MFYIYLKTNENYFKNYPNILNNLQIINKVTIDSTEQLLNIFNNLGLNKMINENSEMISYLHTIKSSASLMLFLLDFLNTNASISNKEIEKSPLGNNSRKNAYKISVSIDSIINKTVSYHDNNKDMLIKVWSKIKGLIEDFTKQLNKFNKLYLDQQIKIQLIELKKNTIKIMENMLTNGQISDTDLLRENSILSKLEIDLNKINIKINTLKNNMKIMNITLDKPFFIDDFIVNVNKYFLNKIYKKIGYSGIMDPKILSELNENFNNHQIPFDFGFSYNYRYSVSWSIDNQLKEQYVDNHSNSFNIHGSFSLSSAIKLIIEKRKNPKDRAYKYLLKKYNIQKQSLENEKIILSNSIIEYENYKQKLFDILEKSHKLVLEGLENNLYFLSLLEDAIGKIGSILYTQMKLSNNTINRSLDSLVLCVLKSLIKY